MITKETLDSLLPAGTSKAALGRIYKLLRSTPTQVTTRDFNRDGKPQRRFKVQTTLKGNVTTHDEVESLSLQLLIENDYGAGYGYVKGFAEKLRSAVPGLVETFETELLKLEPPPPPDDAAEHARQDQEKEAYSRLRASFQNAKRDFKLARIEFNEDLLVRAWREMFVAEVMES